MSSQSERLLRRAKAMNGKRYIIATIKPWNIDRFHRQIRKYPGDWKLITDPSELTAERIEAIAPRYVFFPHWGQVVPNSVLEITECVCFHETDVPYGRGGSPIQNLIAAGHRETMISALQMTDELDAGPVYMKRPLSLEGGGEEIFLRASGIVAKMIREIAETEPRPTPQMGGPVLFSRRKPDESRLSMSNESIERVFDHIRMLDASGYPSAFLEYGDLRIEFNRPALRTDGIVADVLITRTSRSASGGNA